MKMLRPSAHRQPPRRGRGGPSQGVSTTIARAVGVPPEQDPALRCTGISKGAQMVVDVSGAAAARQGRARGAFPEDRAATLRMEPLEQSLSSPVRASAGRSPLPSLPRSLGDTLKARRADCSPRLAGFVDWEHDRMLQS